jgi:hypothetical protein
MGQCKAEGKDSKRDYAEEKLKKTWDSESLRKETLKNRKEDFSSKSLKNRKEDFRSKVLKNCKGVRPEIMKIEKRSKVKEKINRNKQ